MLLLGASGAPGPAHAQTKEIVKRALLGLRAGRASRAVLATKLVEESSAASKLLPCAVTQTAVVPELLTSIDDAAMLAAGEGRISYISVRPERGAPVITLKKVEAEAERGLVGDYYPNRGKTIGGRQVTLIQAEDLPIVAERLGLERVTPEMTRRNLMVEGLRVRSLEGKLFWIGDTLLEGTGYCTPCAKMNRSIADGAFEAMGGADKGANGLGGITARILRGGEIEVGAPIRMATPEETADALFVFRDAEPLVPGSKRLAVLDPATGKLYVGTPMDALHLQVAEGHGLELVENKYVGGMIQVSDDGTRTFMFNSSTFPKEDVRVPKPFASFDEMIERTGTIVVAPIPRP